ncbi:MAG: hypothetical protein AAF517_00800 [Planctomycetota bacterium]
MKRRQLHLLLGLALWCGAGYATYRLATTDAGEGRRLAEELATFATRDPGTIDVILPNPTIVRVGDQVYAIREDGVRDTTRAIGTVSMLLDSDGHPVHHLTQQVGRFRVELFDRRQFWPREQCSVHVAVVPESAGAWALKKLLPPKKLEAIRSEWDRSWRRNRGEITRLLAPIALDLLGDVRSTAEQESKSFLKRHRVVIDRLLRKVESEIDQRELVYLFETSMWPIARRHFEPIANRIGQKIWDRFPLWGLSWRLAYQSLPLTRDDYFDRRWSAFVEDELVPLLKSYSPQYIRASKRVAKETFADPRVRTTVHDTLFRLLGDPDFHRVAQRFVNEVYLENPRFHETLKERWAAPEVQRALRIVSSRLEITTRRITDLIIGTKAEGISPEFAAVLRTQILQKGKRRIFIHPGVQGGTSIADGTEILATLGEDRPELDPHR